MDERSRRIAACASVLAACVLALVALGYGLCLGMLAVSPTLVPTPELVPMPPSADIFQRSMANLLYWMVACVVAIALAVAITLLGAQALRALGEVERAQPSGENR